MRTTIAACVMFAILLVGCSGNSEPSEHVHNSARFKITIPAGWKLISEDDEMFEFRKGDTRLIEVGRFELDFTPDEMADMEDDEITEMLEQSSDGGFKSYCIDARISDYRIEQQNSRVWGGLPAYYIKARGFSNEIDESVVIDLLIAIHRDRCAMYLFASQVTRSNYEKTEQHIKSSIESFQVI